jgi:hypothetical protein
MTVVPVVPSLGVRGLWKSMGGCLLGDNCITFEIFQEPGKEDPRIQGWARISLTNLRRIQ